jgi:hypothetical protein
MGSVRKLQDPAWVPHGGPSFLAAGGSLGVIERDRGAPVCLQGGPMQDLLYIGLVIVVFAALWLLVKGVERFER